MAGSVNYTIFVGMGIRLTCGVVVVLLAIIVAPAMGQYFEEVPVVKYDSTFVQVYRDELTVRTYISRKQNGITFRDGLMDPWIRYRTNDHMVWGLGGTYSFLTVNLAVKTPLLNNDNDLYGNSKYLDLQTHTIFRSIIADLYLQWNRGYYLANPENNLPGWSADQPLPVRGDFRSNVIGLNLQYLFSASRYSYKAAFLQNEFQKKSAGSPIAGIEGYWMLGMADSLMIPASSLHTGFLEGNLFNQLDLANVGINGGYAYTFVWNESLFLSLSSVIGLSGGYNSVHHTSTSTTCCSGLAFGMNNSTRISLGFNSTSYYVGLSYVHFTMNNQVGEQGNWLAYSTGNIRFNVVRRFRLNRAIKILRPDLWTF